MTSAGGVFLAARIFFVLIDEFTDKDEPAYDYNDENNSDNLRNHEEET